jgi:hypothetical protein
LNPPKKAVYILNRPSQRFVNTATNIRKIIHKLNFKTETSAIFGNLRKGTEMVAILVISDPVSLAHIKKTVLWQN